MGPTSRKHVTCIGGNVNVMGKVTLQIPFFRLPLVIDVYLFVLRGEVPTLISMQYMIMNGLGLSLQKKHISNGARDHPVSMENIF